MALKTKVKVGNITNLSDARYCAGMGVDMLGFKIGETEGLVSPIKFKEITDWISGPEFVAETDKPVSAEKYNTGLTELLVSHLPESHTEALSQNFIVRLELGDWKLYEMILLKHADAIRYLLVINSHHVNNILAKSIIGEMAQKFNVLLGFEIESQLLDEYLTWPIAGLALNGSEETSPGIKDYDHLSAILEKLEVD